MKNRKQYLEIGEIVTTQGIRGDVRVYPYTELPEEILDFDYLYLDEDGKQQLEVTDGYVKKNVVVMHFDGIDDINVATKYIGKTLYFNRDDEELEEGQFYHVDLIGCRVEDLNTGYIYGELTDITNYGASDIYWVTKDGKTTLIPKIDDVVKKIDLENDVVYITPLEGLFDDEN